ncbi:MAG: hypothetical protein JRI44_12390 [Deltaproteobacteria bacterium]|nr:hypothetical protein [Deltaproteobacteria bacterium]
MVINFVKKGYIFKWLFLLLLLLMFASCASLEPFFKSDKELLRERFTKYWQARIKNDLVESYKYEDIYVTKRVSLAQYIKSKNLLIKYRDFKILQINIVEKDKARIQFELKYTVFVRGFSDKISKRVMWVTWVKRKGNWYNLYKTPAEAFGGLRRHKQH